MQDRIGQVIKNVKLQENIYEMVIKFDSFEDIKGGQFIHIQLPTKENVLRRPFCICDFDKEEMTITICYAVVGKGTDILANVKVGDKLNAMFPLGNGFKDKDYKKIMLLGGGMGVAVLPAIFKSIPNAKIYTYVGFANKDKVVLEDVLRERSESLLVATDDGSYGEKGYAVNFLKQDIETIKPDVIMACGPTPMFKAVQKVLCDVDCDVYLSLEQRMGCGIGACLVCNCKIKKNGEETYLRVCKDGPVFNMNEVVL